jgi:hypothetical protein
MTTPKRFPADSLVLVEVLGLPATKTEVLTYRASYPVTAGQQIQVPTPPWALDVVYRDSLPGFVLGETDGSGLMPHQIRDILPEPASSLASVQGLKSARKLVDAWRKSSQDLFAEADILTQEATLFSILTTDLENALEGF